MSCSSLWGQSWQLFVRGSPLALRKRCWAQCCLEAAACQMSLTQSFVCRPPTVDVWWLCEKLRVCYKYASWLEKFGSTLQKSNYFQPTMKLAFQTQKMALNRWTHEVTALQVEFFVLKRRPQAGIVLTTRRVFQVTKTPRFLGLMGCAFGTQTDGWWVGGSQPSGPNNKREMNNTSIQEICSNSFTAYMMLARFRFLDACTLYRTTILYCCNACE